MRPHPNFMLVAAASTALLTALAGCSSTNNERPTLGGSLRLPALSVPSVELQTELLGDTLHVRTTRIDRGEWEPTDFLVPVDGTTHNPTWRSPPTYADTDTPRRFGLFPTVESALELDSASGTLAAEGFMAPLGGLVEVAIMPIRAIVSPACRTEQSPEMVYKRTKQGGWWSGPLPAQMQPTDHDANVGNDLVSEPIADSVVDAGPAKSDFLRKPEHHGL